MPIETYLALLPTVDWDALPGVYGAFTLSQKMREVAVEAQARRAVDQILGHVCHQGNLADSALPVARAWSLLVDGSAGRAPLDGLIALAGSAWLGQRHVGFVPRTRRFAGASPASTAETFRARAAYESRSDDLSRILGSAAPALVSCVRSSGAAVVRHLAARLLVETPLAPTGALELDDLVQRAPGDDVRAASLVAAASHGRWGPELAGVARALAASASVYVRSCAAAAELLADGAGARASGREAILSLLTARERDPEAFPWCGGWPAALVADALARAPLADAAVADDLLGALDRWRQHPPDRDEEIDGTVPDQLGERLFERVFAVHIGRRDHATWEDLSAVQRSVVERLGPFGPPLLEISLPRACGFRDLWRDRARLAAARGPLDRVVSWWWNGRFVRWPIWKWVCEAADVDRHAFPGASSAVLEWVAAVLRRELRADECIEAVRDAAGGAYGIPVDALGDALFRGGEDLAVALSRLAAESGFADAPTAATATLAILSFPEPERAQWRSLAEAIPRPLLPAPLRARLDALAAGAT